MYLLENLNVVILSGVAGSRSEAAAQSKDPYVLHAALELHKKILRSPTAATPLGVLRLRSG